MLLKRYTLSDTKDIAGERKEEFIAAGILAAYQCEYRAYSQQVSAASKSAVELAVEFAIGLAAGFIVGSRGQRGPSWPEYGILGRSL